MASELSMRGGELGEPLVLTPLRTNSAVTAYWRGDSDLTVAAREASGTENSSWPTGRTGHRPSWRRRPRAQDSITRTRYGDIPAVRKVWIPTWP